MKPYKVDGKLVNHALDLRHGKSVRSFGIDRVSNAPFHSVSSSSALPTRLPRF